MPRGKKGFPQWRPFFCAERQGIFADCNSAVPWVIMENIRGGPPEPAVLTACGGKRAQENACAQGREISLAMKEWKGKQELPACPVETTLMLIGDKWKVLILRDLLPGTKRFGELKKSIGNVSQKVLTAQLRDMEEKDLITRKVYAEVPPRVEYSLTGLGRSLKPILDAMQDWGREYQHSFRLEQEKPE